MKQTRDGITQLQMPKPNYKVYTRNQRLYLNNICKWASMNIRER